MNLQKKLKKQWGGESRTPLNEYEYPKELITSTKLGKLVCRQQSFKLKREQAYFIRTLDEQKKNNKGIFGAGFLVSKVKSEEVDKKSKMPIVYANKQKGKHIIFSLSEREKQIVENLGKEEN